MNFCGAVDTGSGSIKALDPKPNDEVFAVLAEDGLVYVGGAFTAMDDFGRYRYLAVIDGDTGNPY